MKKLVLDELGVESFVTTADAGIRPGTVRGHADAVDGFTEGESCFFSDCGTCKFTCGETGTYSCQPTCQLACAGES